MASPPAIQCRAVLLDIEGTVSPVAYVYDVMFPFARNHVLGYLESQWGTDVVLQACDQLARDRELASWEDWCGHLPDSEQRDAVVENVHALMDGDAKTTGLKQLQGLVWRQGFESGELVAELFPDVVPQLNRWKKDGFDLFVYSSGSVAAQHLFFGHTTEGNLLNMFSGHFDTTSGPKREANSYRRIAEQIGLAADEVVFISDIADELVAAREAGMPVVLRTESADDALPFPVVHSLDAIELQLRG